jgi:hypothetical protein
MQLMSRAAFSGRLSVLQNFLSFVDTPEYTTLSAHRIHNIDMVNITSTIKLKGETKDENQVGILRHTKVEFVKHAPLDFCLI